MELAGGCPRGEGLLDHACQRSSSIRAARKSEYADFVLGMIILHQELISPHDMRVKVIAESHVDGLVHLRPEWRRDLWDRVRPDTSLIVYHLLALVVLLEHREELHDVRVIGVELVTRPVKAQD